MQHIADSFPISNEEYEALEKSFGELCEFQAWKLFKNNSRNNHTDDQTDIAQELRIAMIWAGSYTKRQIYIEACLRACQKHARDKVHRSLVDELQRLWKDKTRHGACRQKFGPHQEQLLDSLVRKLVPLSERPDRSAKLKIDGRFASYCKTVTWNRLKAMGKKITREKPLRVGQVSLSEFDHLDVDFV